MAQLASWSYARFQEKLISQIWVITTFLSKAFVKLPVGVDWKKKEEGRKEGRKKKNNNPHLAFSRKNDPTCLIFSDCLVGV